MLQYINLIESPFPSDWRGLQAGVKNLFCEIGYSAEQECPVKTPRGTVEIDVLAQDNLGDQKITIISECKNWESRVSQNVVHSFMTIMSETGANLGYIISKNGFQSGALDYTKNTNIICITYKELQEKYLDVWFERFFCKTIGIEAYYLHKYTDPLSRVMDVMTQDHFSLIPYSMSAINNLWAVWNSRKGFDQWGMINKECIMSCLYKFNPDIFGGDNIYLRNIINNFKILIDPVIERLNAAFGENMVVKMYGKELVGL